MHAFSDLHHRCALVLVAALALGASVTPLGAQVALGLSPMRVELPLRLGGQGSGTLTVNNESTMKMRVTAELLDFYIDATGTPQFERDVPAERDYSCRKWLSLNPMEMEIDPSSNVTVRYTLRVPPDAGTQSYHCAVGFTTQPTAEQLGHMGLRTAVRAVTAIYVDTGEAHVDGLLKSIRCERVPGTGDNGWQAVVAVENRGRYYFRPTGKLEVLASTGELVESVDFIPLPVLPAREQNFVLPLKLASGPGAYTLRVLVDLGAKEIQEGTANVVAEAAR